MSASNPLLRRRHRRLLVEFGAAALVSDSFNRGNGAIGSTDGGTLGPKPWTQLKGAWSVTSNQATLASTGNDLAVVDAGVADCTVGATYGGVSGNNGGIAFRVTDVNNWWVLIGGTGGLFLVRSVAGAQTIPASDAIPLSNGDVIAVTLSGARITCKVNGAVRFGGPVSDATFQTVTKHGLGTGGADSFHTWDNFFIA